MHYITCPTIISRTRLLVGPHGKLRNMDAMKVHGHLNENGGAASPPFRKLPQLEFPAIGDEIGIQDFDFLGRIAHGMDGRFAPAAEIVFLAAVSAGKDIISIVE